MLANCENRILYMGNGSYRTFCLIEDEENYEYSIYDSVEFEAAETYAEARGWYNEY
jgi:hypothetical protein